MSDKTVENIPAEEIEELKGFESLTDEELNEKVYSHPLYLAHKLDGKELRICPGDGDIYIGEAVGPEGGVRMSDGGLMCINPIRTGVGCTDQETNGVDIDDDEIKANREILVRALQTLTHCQRHEEDQVTKENGREALLRWEARFKKE